MSTTCVCRLCEEPFESDSPRAVFCPKVHYRECVVCGSFFEVKSKRRPAVTCSPACAAAHRRASNPETLYDCTCLLCGEPFKSKQAKAKFCDRDHYKTCENCGKEYRIKDKYRPGVACSQSCAAALSHTDESRAKRRKNNLEKYGVEYSFQRDDVKAKIAASPEHQASLIGGEKFRKAMLDKYGVENYGATEEHRRFLSENASTWRKPAKPKEQPKRSNKPDRRITKVNRKFAEDLKDLGLTVSFEKKVGNFFYDLHIDGTDVLVDIHPTVSHNVSMSYLCRLHSCELPCSTHHTIEEDYHYRRAKVTMKEGFRLIQVFDWDDTDRVKKCLYEMVRIDKTEVDVKDCALLTLSEKVADAFFDKHHIQGSVRGGKAFYGLFDGGELVAAASFGPARFNKDYEWEWLRYAVKDGYLIHGGPGALFKRFREDFNPKSVVSFADFAHTTGETFFPSLGFTELPLRSSSAVWFNLASGKSVRDSSLVRLGADKLLGTKYGSREECGLGNEEIMVVEGFLKVPTAGNRTFLWSDE